MINLSAASKFLRVIVPPSPFVNGDSVSETSWKSTASQRRLRAEKAEQCRNGRGGAITFCQPDSTRPARLGDALPSRQPYARRAVFPRQRQESPRQRLNFVRLDSRFSFSLRRKFITLSRLKILASSGARQGRFRRIQTGHVRVFRFRGTVDARALTPQEKKALSSIFR